MFSRLLITSSIYIAHLNIEMLIWALSWSYNGGNVGRISEVVDDVLVMTARELVFAKHRFVGSL